MVSLSSALPSQGIGGPPPLHPEQPATSLWGVSKRAGNLYTSYAGVGGAVTWDCAKREVQLVWRRDFGDGQVIYDLRQTEAVAYWPTEACELGPNRICVAGKYDSGKTVLEIWTLKDDETLPQPYGNVQTGEMTYPKSLVIPIEQRSVVYLQDTPGRDTVRNLFWNRATGHKVFVQFANSNDLFELDTQSGQIAKVLAAQSGEPSVEHVPELAIGYNDRWDAEHIIHGYVYFLGYANNTHRWEGFVLYDSDKDGVLDPGAAQVLDTAEWHNLGFDNGDLYVERL